MMKKIAIAEPGHDHRVYVNLHQLVVLRRRASRLTFLPRQPANSVLNGRHASKLRGRGLNFEELRAYLPGDDIRTLDWRVTARTGTPHVRVYTEERDRPTLLLVDQRMSMFFGSQVYMKSVIAAEAAAIAAHLLLAQGDRVGGLVFSDDAISEHRPVRSAVAVHRMLASIADANGRLSARGQATRPDLFNQMLRSAARIAKTNYLVLIFSDFDGVDAASEPLIRRLARHNDLLLFNIADPMAGRIPANAHLAISDGALQAEIDTSSAETHKQIETFAQDRLAHIRGWAQKYQQPFLPLSTQFPALDQISHLLGVS
ncbi:DUF58 domain-containing protein [uncultured Ruegeria sp.]|uniref:DUF58 domain-containing protein n=1 Tax=uncultured Ruegeria sp. TaxID=259304 RepID=UPI0026134205|nr:DUF58 domain-containing protein [uncultured Ruegeria sp.]